MIVTRKLGVFVMLVLLTLSVPISAYGDVGEQQTKQKMKQCMQLVDRTVLEALKIRGAKLNQELVTLCKGDKRKRNTAQNKASDYARELHSSLDLANYRKCRRLVPDKTTELQRLSKQYFISDLRFTHACDGLKP
ncbi:MAG: hypothetical protein JKX75_05425 [Gammaproteobacteria bacterium]|nr:hypothetical protein [Gammaproteobacteria bacterium]